MGYKKARKLFQLFIAGFIILEIVGLSMYMLPAVSRTLMILGVLCCAAAVFTEIFLCRCEHCRRHLSGRGDGDECPNCGEKFK